MRLWTYLPKGTTKRDAESLRKKILDYGDKNNKAILVEHELLPDPGDIMSDIWRLRIVLSDKSTPQDIFFLGEFIGINQTLISHEDKSV